MIDLLRKQTPTIIVAGAHAQIIQSILDFDYIRGKDVPSIVAVVGGTRKTHKCWFGEQEILLSVFRNIEEVCVSGLEAEWLLNIASANSARKMTESFFAHYPEALGVHIFAENVSEQDALALVQQYGESKLIAGPSGVGLLVPGLLKLGAIGGIFGGNINQLAKISGNTAVICSSGGMVNEIVDSVLRAGGAPSFAVSYGGDRFPGTSSLQWCLEAEADPQTEHIIFFGELGGQDEYAIAKAVKDGKIKKPVYAYIAGHYVGGEEVQFGHAKALAKTPDESADEKMKALTAVGVTVSATYGEFILNISKLKHIQNQLDGARLWQAPEVFRKPSTFTAVKDKGEGTETFVRHALCTLLEKESVSDELVEFSELAYSLLIDHGAEVSGAVNTMITTRAGKDMSSALASGILTVGDRFGGAISGAAKNWFNSTKNNVSVEDMLEQHKQKGEYVLGIGHLKYSVYENDPRVERLITAAKQKLKKATHLKYAESVAKRTTQKKPNLILNVDGAVAAILLDILIECDEFSESEIEELVQIEFFNSFFLIPRTVGFIGNFLSQRRRDEGLFRLPPDQIFYE